MDQHHPHSGFQSLCEGISASGDFRDIDLGGFQTQNYTSVTHL